MKEYEEFNFRRIKETIFYKKISILIKLVDMFVQDCCVYEHHR